MSTKVKKFIVGALMITSVCGIVTGCGSTDNKTDNNAVQPTTPEVTTPEATTPEPTTEEPTTEEPSTEYVYKGTKISFDESLFDYFNGLILEKGDIIYVNELYPEESSEYDGSRGSIANALLKRLKMEEEKELLEEKYWVEGMYVPEIPYSDNYFIEYTGEKVKFVFVESEDGGVFFDIVPVE